MFGIEMGFGFLTWGRLVMFIFAGVLIYLGIAKKWEPLLLVPIGFGILLVNIPLGYHVMGFMMPDGTMLDYLPPTWSSLMEQGGQPIGFLSRIFQYGFGWELIPLFMFIGIGAMTDFSPLIARPIYFLLGAAAQVGVYVAFFMALALGFNIPEACSIGIIGGADGPTTVYLTTKLAPWLLGATAIAAYTYMAMVPLIQPPIIRAITTKEERQRYMKPQLRFHISLSLFLGGYCPDYWRLDQRNHGHVSIGGYSSGSQKPGGQLRGKVNRGGAVGTSYDADTAGFWYIESQRQGHEEGYIDAHLGCSSQEEINRPGNERAEVRHGAYSDEHE